MQPSSGPLQQGPAGRLQIGLLVHRLIGAAGLEPFGAISREQQQRQGTEISLHRRRQQIGHRRSGGGDHRGGLAIGAGLAQGKKGCGALINAGEQR